MKSLALLTCSLVYCGVAKKLHAYKESRIVGGTEVSGSEYPWMVSFKYIDLSNKCGYITGHFCGGTVTQSDYDGFSFFLSAAHCFDDLENDLEETNQFLKDTYGADCNVKLIAEIGRDDTDDLDEENIERVYIDDLLIHEDWNPDENNKADIALLWASTPVTPDPVILQKTKGCCDSGGIPVRVIGYGADSDGEPTDKLEYADLETVNFDSCKNYWRDQLRRDMICADDSDSDACNGDSGGPLMDGTDKGATQVGIVSFGGEECAGEAPTVWIEVGHYYDWITNSTANVNLTAYPDDKYDAAVPLLKSLWVLITTVLGLALMIQTSNE